MMHSSTMLIHMVDTYLADLGTQSLIDGDKVRDLLMDLRLVCMALEAAETEEALSDVVPAPLVADPALITEIIAPF